MVSCGITPARAGKTESESGPLPFRWDHPRSCGKDPNSSIMDSCRSGSPPLVRERPLAAANDDSLCGITPARAGKTTLFLIQDAMHRDHPRSCGKDLPRLISALFNTGSPPLVRERPHCERLVTRNAGITPARAGKTDIMDKHRLIDEDYPRSCGKDSLISHSIRRSLGLPPLVRERPFFFAIFLYNRRITPARAGKTTRLKATRIAKQDYPRSCGKDISAGLLSVWGAGLPPLVRERPSTCYKTKRAWGITPARAGKTNAHSRGKT